MTKSERKSSRVSFNEDATETIVVDPTSPQKDSWYSSDELHRFRKSINTTENKPGRRASSSMRKDFVRAILEVQSEHQAMGISDPKGLRQMSKASSKPAMTEAIRRAHAELVEDLY
jgi:hypothetical protein